MRAAHRLQLAAARQLRDYVRRAHEDGIGWRRHPGRRRARPRRELLAADRHLGGLGHGLDAGLNHSR